MKTILKLFFSFIVIFNSCLLKAQSFNPKNFDSKVRLSEFLLMKQPSRDSLERMLPSGYKIESLKEFQYVLKDSSGVILTAYLHIKTLKIVYVEFYEKQEYKKELYDYLTKNKNFEYVASEHMCDFMNNKKISFTICPGMEEGMMINISKYDI